jgi:hypothetical protein
MLAEGTAKLSALHALSKPAAPKVMQISSGEKKWPEGAVVHVQCKQTSTLARSAAPISVVPFPREG